MAMTFQGLPQEMQMAILKCASLDVKKNGRLVCKRWLTMIDETVRFIIAELNSQDTLDRCFASKLKFKSIVTSDFDYNGRSFKFPPTTSSRNPFPKTRKLVLGHGITQETMRYFLRYAMPKTKYLKIEPEAFTISDDFVKKFPQIVSVINWNNLRKLSIVAYEFRTDEQEVPVSAKTLLLKLVKIPNLEHLKFSSLYEEDELEILQILITEFINFLVRHKKTLRHLQGSFYNTPNLIGISDHIQNIKSQLVLKTFDFKIRNWRNSHGRELENLALACLHGQKNLASLTFRGYRFESEFPNANMTSLENGIKEVLDKSGPTLEYVKLDLKNIDYSWLRKCIFLKTLVLLNVDKIETPFSVHKLQLLTVTSITFDRCKNFGPECATWVVEHLPNLSIFGLSMHYVRINPPPPEVKIPTIQILIEGLKFLRRMRLWYYAGMISMPDLKSHCESVPGIEVENVTLKPRTHFCYCTVKVRKPTAKA